VKSGDTSDTALNLSGAIDAVAQVIVQIGEHKSASEIFDYLSGMLLQDHRQLLFTDQRFDMSHRNSSKCAQEGMFCLAATADQVALSLSRHPGDLCPTIHLLVDRVPAARFLGHLRDCPVDQALIAVRATTVR
jgi:hypothetical protein